MSKCSLINSKKLFSNVLPSMIEKGRMIQELVENAMRANAQTLRIRLEKEEEGPAWLYAENDGDVLDAFINLLKIAESHYDEDVIESQNPAGMGVMSYLAVSSECLFHSGAQLLRVQSRRFFDDEAYREGILETIEEAEYFQGMKIAMKIEGGTGFIESYFTPMTNDKEGDWVRSERLQYYPLTIRYNGAAVAQKRPEMLIETVGTGSFEGLQIGIPANFGYHIDNKRECGVFWFGKHIPSNTLSPFTVIVDKKCAALQPRLPDRASLANTRDELDVLREELETQLHDAIQDYLMTHHDMNLLGRLKHAYDVEHFVKWDEASKGMTRLVVDTDEVLFSLVESDADLLKAPQKYYTRGSVDFGGAPIVEGSRLSLGGTPAPSWYMALVLDKTPHIVAYGGVRESRAASVGDRWIYPARRLLLEGYEITAFADDEGDARVSMQDDADPYDFFCSLSDSLSDFNSEQVYDELTASFDAVIDALRDRVRGVGAIFTKLLTMAGAGWRDEITRLEFDLAKETISYEVNGQTHTASYGRYI